MSCSPNEVMLGRDVDMPNDLILGRDGSNPKTACSVGYTQILQHRMMNVNDCARETKSCCRMMDVVRAGDATTANSLFLYLVNVLL